MLAEGCVLRLSADPIDEERARRVASPVPVLSQKSTDPIRPTIGPYSVSCWQESSQVLVVTDDRPATAPRRGRVTTETPALSSRSLKADE